MALSFSAPRDDVQRAMVDSEDFTSQHYNMMDEVHGDGEDNSNPKTEPTLTLQSKFQAHHKSVTDLRVSADSQTIYTASKGMFSFITH
ncbi:MAG: hypothetical protein MHPSP_004446 [Paramarteilia canceri]